MRSISQLFWTHVAVKTSRHKVYREARSLELSSRQSRLVWRYCRDDVKLMDQLKSVSTQVSVAAMLRVVEANVHSDYFKKGIVPGSLASTFAPFNLPRASQWSARWRPIEEVIMMSNAGAPASYAARAPSTLDVEAIIAASAAVVPYSYFEPVAKAGADPAPAWVAEVPEAYAVAAAQAGFDPVHAWREAVSFEYLVAS